MGMYRVRRACRLVMRSVVSWWATLRYIKVTQTITTKHTGWPMTYGPIPWSPTTWGVSVSMAIVWPGTIIPHWAMSMTQWRSWLHWDYSSGLALMLRGLWRMTCAAAKARAGHPVAQLGLRCGQTTPCRGVVSFLPLYGLLHWQGMWSTSPWTESTGGVASRGGICSEARGGTSINGRFWGIIGEKDWGLPLHGGRILWVLNDPFRQQG
jgi:hypothetical protein